MDGHMFKKIIITMIALSMFIAFPAIAKKKGSAANACKDKDVVGAYAASEPSSLPIPYPTGENGFRSVTYVYQLNINAGGTATMNWTGGTDFMVTEGKIAMYHGSWKCRKDGKLLVSTIGAVYQSTDYNPYQDALVTDIELEGHNRHNRLFSIEDPNTVVLRQTVRRFYPAEEDPMDPLGGYPFPEFFPDIVFSRLSPSDEGLTP